MVYFKQSDLSGLKNNRSAIFLISLFTAVEDPNLFTKMARIMQLDAGQFVANNKDQIINSLMEIECFEEVCLCMSVIILFMHYCDPGSKGRHPGSKEYLKDLSTKGEPHWSRSI